MASIPPVSITIDRGGTFCDVWAHTADGKETIFKLLSVDPASYPDAPTEGIRRVLEQITGQSIPKGQPIDGSLIESVRVGTTVATNALLERKGERFALLTTEGFRDICRIGDQTRPDLFDLNIRKPGVLYSQVIEVAERVTVEDYVLNPHPAEIDLSDPDLVKTASGEGGTSTDISRFDKVFEHVFDTTISGTTITSPMLDVKTVAAGGGSILSWRNGLFVVGPESAGAHPGPASYRKGGPLTITDANLFLGRLVPEKFPSIFGPHANEPLDVDVVKQKFHELTDEINDTLENKLTAEEVASGFLAMANETMSRPIRNITEARGFAINKHNLASFGGAGGQHACAIAQILGMPRIIIHKYSSILSAYGIGLADIVSETAVPAAYAFSEKTLDTVLARFEELKAQTRAELVAQGVQDGLVEHQCYLSMRYEGSDTNLSILQPQDNDFRTAFVETHRLYELAGLPPKSAFTGPALVIDNTQTILVETGCKVSVLNSHIIIDLPSKEATSSDSDTSINPVELSTFASRFMSIAEQMGNTLQRTSISTSIKERLDFSCALFTPDGKLVANAPHIPVHLGSMQFAIQHQHALWAGKLQPGDVLLTNHPECGGTHLPDLTVVTPVFAPTTTTSSSPGQEEAQDQQQLIFYVASRGHHTDIGGIGITSMVPDSKFLWQEGLSVRSMRIVHGGVFDEAGVRQAFADVVDYGPGCSATRRLDDNVSDLKAQIAANQRGIVLLQAMCREAGVPRVQRYMYGIQATAELAVRELFRRIAEERGAKESLSPSSPSPSHSSSSAPSSPPAAPAAPVVLRATDYYDDGTPITLAITIAPDPSPTPSTPLQYSATFDFTGTGPQTLGNMNCPPSITHSAVIYALRCLINLSIPLNQGCLAPVRIVLPRGTILNPTAGVAVCGSTIASQRVTDVILRAFGAAAGSACDEYEDDGCGGY
ncbi:putative hydantoinase b oxoprolinase [Diplodia seriata]|uniref:Putative hydantoinase b oxoprolinase n=1 Tax=Diplodia seriata TaxID=420778 RepID=A0A0G2DZZ9_9PEZI|nr:putative hydantoinase b oxoprolinase [Diplodia seriata]